MSQHVFTTPSADAAAVLRQLKQSHNVLIQGPPATGKSRLLAELKHWFCQPPRPSFRPNGPVAFPSQVGGHDLQHILPSPERTDRRAFSITFHQGTKYRDFVSGLMPTVSGSPGFCVTTGPFLEAADHADKEHGTAILIIDEVNRGPAVAVFGDAIGPIESDKRKLPDGQSGPLTVTLPVLRRDGTFQGLALSYHLYIVAAMNQADTSVEPMDVAFLRRFEHYVLQPDESLLRDFLGLQPRQAHALPDEPASPQDVLEAVTRAWQSLNTAILIGKGGEYQLGHGALMDRALVGVTVDMPGALEFAVRSWRRLYGHISEVFFGDTRGLAATLGAGSTGSPFRVEEIEFGDNLASRVSGPAAPSIDQVYSVVHAIGNVQRL